MGLGNGIFPIRARGPQLRLDFECWISHCRVMSARQGDTYSLSWLSPPPRPQQTRGQAVPHTPSPRHSPMLSFSLQEME